MKKISNIIAILAVLLIVFSGYKLIGYYTEYKEADDFYEDTITKYVTIEAPEKIEISKADTEEEASSEEDEWYSCVDVDFDSLEEINSEIVGWIYFENEDINYPILHSPGNNDKYLRTSYTGKYLYAGSIFLDGRNAKDFSDDFSIVYGHNMKNLSMFGKLRYYRNQKDYYENHKYFQIITKDKKMRFEIFDYKVVNVNNSLYDLNYDSGTDKVITLSTCTAGDDRLVVLGKLIDEY